MKIWVFAESEGDKPTTATLELLTKAREIADTVEAVYVGKNGDAIAPQLGEYGAAKVFTADQGDSLSGVIGAAVIARHRRGRGAGRDPVRAELRRA